MSAAETAENPMSRKAARNGLRRRFGRRTPAWLGAVVIGGLATWLPAQQDDDSGTGGQYSLPRSQDDIAELREALDHLHERRWEAGIERLMHLWREATPGVIAEVDAIDRWRGLRARVVATLRDLDPDGRAALERLAAREMGPLARTPLVDLADEELTWLARSFPTAVRGVAARLRLGDLALERGDALEAMRHFRAASDGVNQSDPIRTNIDARMRVVDLVVRGTLDPLDDDSPLAATVDAALSAVGNSGWPGYGGGYDGSRAMTDPFGQPKEPYHVPLDVDGFELNQYAMHAVGDLRALFVVDGHSVHAIDPVGRRVIWDAPGPMVGSREVREFRDGINPDVVLACALGDDVVVAALQVPKDVIGAEQTRQYQHAMTIVQRIPSRRLFAFDRTTGKPLWAHWDTEDGPLTRRFDGHDACGAPLIAGDTVFSPVHDPTGAISYSISAYDLRTGEVRWRTLICASQQEVNMFGNSRQEFAAGPIALRDGVVFGTTNLGIVYAVDAEDGDVRWLSGYPSIPLPPAQLQSQERRAVFFANNPIVFNDGVLATTPLDSEYAIGIDAASGSMLWRMRYRAHDDVSIRWLLGAIGDEFILSGSGIVATPARPAEPTGRASVRLVASETALGEGYYRTIQIPRGALTRDRIWFVGSDGGIRILDERGNQDPRMADLKPIGRGNLLLVDGLLAITSDGGVTVWADPEGLARAARQRVERRPDDPSAILRLARLERARLGDAILTSAAERTESLFARGLELAEARGLGRGSKTWQELADGLFQLAFDRARAERTTAPKRARERLERARDIALDAGSWLRAQEEILDLRIDDAATMRAEFERMAQRWPDEVFVFRQVGNVRVGTWARLASVPFAADSRTAVRLCQELIERRGDERIGERSVRELAIEALRGVVTKYGPEALAELEADADLALENAGTDADALSLITRRFPLSGAARRATAMLLDAAVARGDLDVAARTYAEENASQSASSGLIRRLIAVASKRGNRALAVGLARRLIARSGSERSDFAADEGRSYAEVLRELDAVAPSVPHTLELPAEPIATLLAPNVQSIISFVRVQSIDGFETAGNEPASRMPLLVSIDGTQLLAFEMDPLPKDLSDSRYSLQLRGPPGVGSLVEPVLLCGPVLAIADRTRLIGVDRTDGHVRWEFTADAGRELRVLGDLDGALIVQSASASTRADDATITAIEPLTGTWLARIEIGALAHIAIPVLSAGAVWFLDNSDRDHALARAFDPLTGVELPSTPLDNRLLSSLQLTDASAHRFDALRSAIFADDERLYLPVDTSQVDEPSRFIALRRGTGDVAWRWAGTPGCALNRFGRRDDRIAIFERSALVARLVLLDLRGTVVASFDQAALATAHGWNEPRKAGVVPDPILLSDKDQGLRLTCVSLKAGGPRFQLDLSRSEIVIRDPIVGGSFLVLPTLPRGRAEPMIQVVDLATRRSALPDGRAFLRLDLSRPTRVFEHDGHLILQTLESIRILGTNR